MEQLKQDKKCPYCSRGLPEDAVFCPYCTRIINRRTAVKPLLPWRQLLLIVLALLAVPAAAAVFWYGSRARVYDEGGAELLYSLNGTEYRILVGWMNDPFYGAETVYQPVAEQDIPYTFPQCLFINDPASGSNLKDEFMAQVERADAQFVRTEDGKYPWTCDKPTPRPDYTPEAALTASIHFSAWSGEGDLVWELEMKNGDLLRLHQKLIAQPYQVLRFTPEDTPMSTIEELQALMDSIPDRLTTRFDAVEIELPPVRYEGGLRTELSNLTLYGSEDEAGNRTTFTGTVQLACPNRGMSYFHDIDFLGSGEGIGVSASARLHLTGCRTAGWRTGVLAYGEYTWVNLQDCVVEDNEIGFHFNAAGTNVSHTIYDGNLFRHNGTAVLLESIPTDVSLSFPGTRFEDNGTDIDNRCGQSVELDEN